jgi:hypothetical protein
MKHNASHRRPLFAAILLLVLLSALASDYTFSHGYTLYFGDAEAHLNIARRVFDSRTPGPEQLGTVWLPLPHILLIPFSMNDAWWQSGFAGVLPSAACFIAAGFFLFAAARRMFQQEAAAWAALLLFALNPNMLYLQSAPMTEPVFAAALAALLWSTLCYRDTQSPLALLAAAVASNAASLTRYEGWFLIPFTTLFFLIAAQRKWHAVLFGALAALAPLSWLAHNQYYYSNALEFYNGPYSAMAIYQRQLAGGMARYPGDHNLPVALQYFLAAIRLTSGWPLLWIGLIGTATALVRKRLWWPTLLLALPPAFYLWSMYGSGTPIFVPGLSPNSFYNTRYGLAALPLLAMGTASLVAWLPRKAAIPATTLLVIGLGIFWSLPAHRTPVTFEESRVNSLARRAWVNQAATLLQQNYRPGSGIIFSFGDLSAVLRVSGIPFRAGLHEGNMPFWDAAVIQPDIFLREEWAVAISGDPVATAILRAQRHGPHYQLEKQIVVKGAPVIELYRREDRLLDSPTH